MNKRHAAWVALVLVVVALGYIVVRPGAIFEGSREAPPTAVAPNNAVTPRTIAAPDSAATVDIATPPNIATAPNVDTPQVAASPPLAVGATSSRYGLSFAAVKGPGLPSSVVHLNCTGEPALVERPHRGSCNPYHGDTSCQRELPVACFKSTGKKAPSHSEPDFYRYWTSGQLATTLPVAGTTLKAAADGSALCRSAFGPHWRMAEFHDGGGWGMQGELGPGIPPNTRYWVHINDQPGNCWDHAR